MKKCVFILFAFLPFSQLFSQTIEGFHQQLTTISQSVPLLAPDANQCQHLVNELESLSQNVKEYIHDHYDQMSSNERKQAKETWEAAEAVSDFVRCVGNSAESRDFIKEKDMETVRHLVNFTMHQVYEGKFCADLYEVRMNKFICLLAFKPGTNSVWRIKSLIKWNKGAGTRRGDRGLAENEYSPIWKNANRMNVQSYQIISINCTQAYTPTTDFNPFK